MKNSKPNGTHYLIGLSGCDKVQLNDMSFWKKTLLEASNEAQIPVLKNYFYQFEPQGLTGFLLLASSHISVHTWPELGYAALDVFTCSDQERTQKAVDFILKEINFKKKNIKKRRRGYVVEN